MTLRAFGKRFDTAEVRRNHNRVRFPQDRRGFINVSQRASNFRIATEVTNLHPAEVPVANVARKHAERPLYRHHCVFWSVRATLRTHPAVADGLD